ncbi:hypothetical protein N0V95_009390 [Ascochyta clinopodiicola]|nr:hypothetical protein N0V95_009390 [Ascochyta clinopodiicola]
MSLARNPFPTRKDTAIADKRQLAGYDIPVDNKGIELPSMLADFVKTLKRGREQEPSRYAQAITDIRWAASVKNEITAWKMIKEHILFRGEDYPGQNQVLTLKDLVNLTRDCLPNPPRVAVPDL